jgi:hydrogenase nickel incorporation protein HypA/HybF
MHEMSIALSMMDLVSENARMNNAKKISRINVVVGNRSGVSADSLRFCFDALKEDTIAGSAELVIEETTATARCTACISDVELGQYDFACPVCGGPVAAKGGEELSVRSIEIE